MHIHAMTPGVAGLHSAAAAEKAAVAQRAAETRRKLWNRASELGGSEEEISMVSRWSEEEPGGQQHHQPAQQPAFDRDGMDEEQTTRPVSIWA